MFVCVCVCVCLLRVWLFMCAGFYVCASHHAACHAAAGVCVCLFACVCVCCVCGCLCALDPTYVRATTRLAMLLQVCVCLFACVCLLAACVFVNVRVRVRWTLRMCEPPRGLPRCCRCVFVCVCVSVGCVCGCVCARVNALDPTYVRATMRLATLL